MRPWRVWQNWAITAAGGGAVALLGLVSNVVTSQECLTETENEAGRHCDYLHGHPEWLLAPALLVAVAFGLVLLRRSARWQHYLAVTLFLAVCPVVLIAPSLWVAAAGHGGG